MAPIAGSDPKKLTREWLEELCARKQKSPRAIAIKAGVSPSTVYRALDEASDFVPSTTTIAKISSAWNVPAPAAYQSDALMAVAGFEEPEMQELADLPASVSATPTNDQSHWTIRTRALELLGVMMGDIVTVDMAVKPRPGDIVCAQVYNFDRGSAETVIRQFKPPYIVTKTMDGQVDDEPVLVDDRRVVVVGTVVQVLRKRAA